MTAQSTRRLMLFDDNIRAIGGHFLELASQLVDGGNELGYESRLAAHATFRDMDQVDPAIRLSPEFRPRRMVHWSLGVDGRSRTMRDLRGRPIGGTLADRIWHRFRDPLSRRDRRPQVMLNQWSDDFLRLLTQWNPTPDDRLVINTGDDFVMLAMARALSNAMGQGSIKHPLNIHVVFHFAVFEGATITPRARRFGQQVNDALAQTQPHHVHLHATTTALSKQLQQVGVKASPIPYPTRPREAIKPLKRKVTAPEQSGTARSGKEHRRLKMLMAGMPRAEKGRGEIHSLLAAMEQPLLRTGHYRVSMQMPTKRWKRMIPVTLMPDYIDANSKSATSENPLEILSSDLSAQCYHDWLDTADIGTFLYDPRRYVARCSGVLLEMFVRGIPVIVPDHCWLADQVRLAGGDGSVGYIYRSTGQIPSLLEQARQHYLELRGRAIANAHVIARRHRGANTLKQMGIDGVSVAEKRMAA